MASGRGHWCSSLAESFGEANVIGEIVQFIVDPRIRTLPAGSTRELHKDVRRRLRCLMKQTSRSTREAIKSHLCARSLFTMSPDQITDYFVNRIWPMILTSADEHVVCTMKWYLLSQERLAERATCAANLLAKIALNTTPRAKWKNSGEPHLFPHVRHLRIH